MSKELLLAAILLSISTVLKICSVMALCQNVHKEPAHIHQEVSLKIKRVAQKTTL